MNGRDFNFTMKVFLGDFEVFHGCWFVKSDRGLLFAAEHVMQEKIEGKTVESTLAPQKLN